MYYEYLKMKPGEETDVIDVVTSTFNEFVAPGFSEQGISEFFKYANTEALAKRALSNHFTIVARKDHEPVGIIEIRDCNHVSMFFVKKEFQKSGIGKALLEKAIDSCIENNPGKFTVNASLNAVEAYRKMGFVTDGGQQCAGGIRFVPMSMVLK